MYVEDLDLRLDDEHVRVHGKGGTVRTVLLDDRGYVALLKLYLGRAGYTSGPLFRASINGRAGRCRTSRTPPVEEILRCRRDRHRHPPAPPLTCHRAESERSCIERIIRQFR